MLRELVEGEPWDKSRVRGLCANKDCLEVGGKACERCGQKYCCATCQSVDWYARHKDHCEEKNIARTKIIFGLHKKRCDDYVSGKTSFDRYFSIALHKIKKIECPMLEISKYAYVSIGEPSDSGRIKTVLEDHEQERSSYPFGYSQKQVLHDQPQCTNYQPLHGIETAERGGRFNG